MRNHRKSPSQTHLADRPWKNDCDFLERNAHFSNKKIGFGAGTIADVHFSRAKHHCGLAHFSKAGKMRGTVKQVSTKGKCGNPNGTMQTAREVAQLTRSLARTRNSHPAKFAIFRKTRRLSLVVCHWVVHR